MRNGEKKITVNKESLIVKLKENRDSHVKEYHKAVAAYKIEALKQLEAQVGEVEKGSLKAEINLISPVNAKNNYNDIIQMFEWDILKEVELDQSEFREYVQDKMSFAVSAKFHNMSYMG